MMSMNESVVLLSLLALAGWFWLDSISARDIALAAAQRACQRAEVQLLDHTVARERIRLIRSRQGHVTILRVYRFEFATDGEHRYQGVIALLGKHVEEVDMQPYRL